MFNFSSVKITIYRRAIQGDDLSKLIKVGKVRLRGKCIVYNTDEIRLPAFNVGITPISEYNRNINYYDRSAGKVNTHIKFKPKRNEFLHQSTIFAYLNPIQYFKLRYQFEETDFQKNPVQYYLLVIALFSIPFLPSIFKFFVSSSTEELKKPEVEQIDIVAPTDSLSKEIRNSNLDSVESAKDSVTN